ncbi:TPA: flagellin [Bacillus cereus]|uniref:flagellin N-terminal helical domain-containing protein n=1 Tax=Bacillus cereus TaxID=1396 RepID=UPI000BF4A329|nr:flagellin [Bacillus cereus]EKS7843823.1 flagellin [Bacillus cereus]PFO64020.1 flagellin [Bacillus cereus]PGW89141.1 flagellin [Bacillus cereus]PGY44451.1 flagellin [Bacillus cereus]HDR4542281.1 flagellin [Bacillus cereus]
MRINTNINSMRTQEYMRQNQAKMSNSMDRLSSGKRINNASDDAAGLAIATRMRARENGLGVAANNTQDGMSLIRTADSAMNSVSNILLRMRDLANQSANGTNTDKNQAALNKEFDALKEQINYISTNTEFNDKKLLDGSNKSIAIQTLDNADTNKQININLSNTSTKALEIDSLTISGSTPITGKTTTSKITAEQLEAAKSDIETFTKAQAALADLKPDTTSGGTTTPGSSEDDIKLAVTNFKNAFEKMKPLMSDEDITTVQTKIDAFKADAPTLKAAQDMGTAFADTMKPAADKEIIKAATKPNASDAIAAIDKALTTVADSRATLGATLNRLDFNVNNLKSQASSMASAASQIEDADMAKEMSEMTKFKILNEAGISMLSQANQTPQMVSKLLQ